MPVKNRIPVNRAIVNFHRIGCCRKKNWQQELFCYKYIKKRGGTRKKWIFFKYSTRNTHFRIKNRCFSFTLTTDSTDYHWFGWVLAFRPERSGLLEAGRWLLNAGCWLLVAGCWWLVAGPLLFEIYLQFVFWYLEFWSFVFSSRFSWWKPS